MLQIRDEPNRPTKKARECNQFRWPVPVFAQKVFFRNPKEVERYHGFPRGAVTLWPARMQAVCKQNAISFGEFCASLKGDDEKP